MCDFKHPETCEKCADGYLKFKSLGLFKEYEPITDHPDV